MAIKFKNDGRAFEELFTRVASAYRHQRIMRLEKVEPPTRIIGGGMNRKVIFLRNPYPDFCGCWSERAGRLLMIEAKSTRTSKLEIGANISDNQIDWLHLWHSSGAAVGVVWESEHRFVFLPIGTIRQIQSEGRRHIKFEEADPIPQGKGMILFDFVVNLRRWYPA